MTIGSAGLAFAGSYSDKLVTGSILAQADGYDDPVAQPGRGAAIAATYVDQQVVGSLTGQSYTDLSLLLQSAGYHTTGLVLNSIADPAYGSTLYSLPESGTYSNSVLNAVYLDGPSTLYLSSSALLSSYTSGLVVSVLA